jgi:hypothetical protein
VPLLSNTFSLCEVCPGCKGVWCVRCSGNRSRLKTFAALDELRAYVAQEPVWPSPKLPKP